MDNSTIVEAAKMLREMEKEAMEHVKLGFSNPGNDNTLSYGGCVIQAQMGTDKREYVVNFSINGRLHTIKGVINNSMSMVKETILKEVTKATSLIIADLIWTKLRNDFNDSNFV